MAGTCGEAVHRAVHRGDLDVREPAGRAGRRASPRARPAASPTPRRPRPRAWCRAHRPRSAGPTPGSPRSRPRRARAGPPPFPAATEPPGSRRSTVTAVRRPRARPPGSRPARPAPRSTRRSGGRCPARSARRRPAPARGCRGRRTAAAGPTARTGTSHSRSCSAWVSVVPTPPARPPSSTVTTSRKPDASDTSSSDTGSTQRGSTTVTSMPWSAARSATARHIGTIEPTATSSTSGPLPAAQHVDRAAPLQRRDVDRRRALREADDGRPVGDRDRLAQRLAQRRLVARRGHPHAGHHGEDRHVPHAVVRGAVRAGHPGPVQDDGHRLPVQGDVHQQLVERPVEERRVDGDDRVQPAHGQARRPR